MICARFREAHLAHSASVEISKCSFVNDRSSSMSSGRCLVSAKLISCLNAIQYNRRRRGLGSWSNHAEWVNVLMPSRCASKSDPCHVAMNCKCK